MGRTGNARVYRSVPRRLSAPRATDNNTRCTRTSRASKSSQAPTPIPGSSGKLAHYTYLDMKKRPKFEIDGLATISGHGSVVFARAIGSTNFHVKPGLSLNGVK